MCVRSVFFFVGSFICSAFSWFYTCIHGRHTTNGFFTHSYIPIHIAYASNVLIEEHRIHNTYKAWKRKVPSTLYGNTTCWMRRIERSKQYIYITYTESVSLFLRTLFGAILSVCVCIRVSRNTEWRFETNGSTQLSVQLLDLSKFVLFVPLKLSGVRAHPSV